ncbi:MAG: DNA recombination protein RmuC [Puia sp.]|nr:DNA recombination protein RmuC [Puia sp.]
MELLLLLISCLLLVVVLGLLLFRPAGGSPVKVFSAKIEELQTRFGEELRTGREETAVIARDNRAELNNTLREFRSELIGTLSSGLRELTLEQGSKLEGLTREQKALTEKTASQLERILSRLEEKLTLLNMQARQESRLAREAFDRNIDSFNSLQREKFDRLEERQTKLVEETEKKLEEIRTSVEEKLQKTLSERLGQSFETVGRQLIEVQKGLGEMQTLAIDVGSLKKVLNNVKIRGGMGEVQLSLLLEQILAPGQYDANVRIRPGSLDTVEFAIKFPGRDEEGQSFVYLPVDAKFPKDAYERLLDAYEKGASDEIEPAIKNLENTIRKMARDIRDKYISPPHTTDFAVLFLPFEGIYSEVIRRSGLMDQLQQEYKVAVAGPTTLAAYLNSLQMGFRTLALQQRSSEVWRVLAGVKMEFEKFGGLLEKAQKNIHYAGDTLDELLGKRTKAINRRLRSVEALPAADVKVVLPEIGPEANETRGDDGKEADEEKDAAEGGG